MTVRIPRSFLPSLLFVSLLTAAASAAGQSQGNPRLDYMLQCQGCHLADGSSWPEIGIHSMIGLAERFLDDPEGRAYLIQVPGVSQAPLDDRAIADLLNWILARFRADAKDADFAPYSEQEVARYRAADRIDVVATRARLIERHLPQKARRE